MRTALVVVVASFFALGCGGTPAPIGVQTSESTAARSTAATPYPIEWARELPPASKLDVEVAHIEPQTGDLIIGGSFTATTRMGGALLDPVLHNDGFVARVSAGDGAQVWVIQLGATTAATVRGIGGGDVEGLWIEGTMSGMVPGLSMSREGRDTAFIAQLDQLTGAPRMLASFGKHGSGRQIFGPRRRRYGGQQ